ncbi:MAG: sulfite exporter TauE/SafE family protein [Chloroflexota bacterium]
MELTPAAFAIVMLAAIAQGVTGFGFGLVLVPLFSLLYDPKTAVMVSLSLGFLSKLPILWLDRGHVQWRLIAPLTVTSLVGNALGTQVLLFASGPALRLAIGLIVAVLAGLQFCNFRVKIRREGLATVLVGLISGTLTGATSMGGPPVVLFGVNQRWAKESIRANMVALSSLTFGFSAGLIAASGAFSRELVTLELWLLPAVALGLLVGNYAFGRAPRELMYRVLALFVIATGLVGAWSGATTLLRG